MNDKESEMKIYESHEDDFAKIVRASSGRQVLVYCDSDDGEGRPQMMMMTVVDGVTVQINAGFNSTIEGCDKRDLSFNNYDIAAADKFEAMAIRAVLDNQATDKG